MLKTIAILLLGALSATNAPAARRPDVDAVAEAKLAKVLEGRVAGKPTDCIFLRDIDSSDIYDHTAIVYKLRGGTLYVNRPASGGAFLRNDDILVTNTHTSQLCSIDTVSLVDRSTQFPSGSVGLGKFVPYPRNKTPK